MGKVQGRQETTTTTNVGAFPTTRLFAKKRRTPREQALAMLSTLREDETGPCHLPAGSPEGGQFTGCGGGGSAIRLLHHGGASDMDPIAHGPKARELHDRLTKEVGPWVQSLSTKEFDAVELYTDDAGYRLINRYLLYGEVPEGNPTYNGQTIPEIAKSLVGAVERGSGTVPADVRLFRGDRYRPAYDQLIKAFERGEPAEYTCGNVMSCSISSAVAMHYAARKGDEGSVLFRIRDHGTYVGGEREMEAMLPPGTRFRVTAVKETPFGDTMVDLEPIGRARPAVHEAKRSSKKSPVKHGGGSSWKQRIAGPLGLRRSDSTAERFKGEARKIVEGEIAGNLCRVDAGQPDGGQFTSCGSGTNVGSLVKQALIGKSLETLVAGRMVTMTQEAERSGVPLTEYEKTHLHELAQAETQANIDLSKGTTKDRNTIEGRYTEARLKLHEEILDRIVSPNIPSQEHPVAVILGGLPGSGKTTALASTLTMQDKVYVNADDIKAMLPGFQGELAAVYHDESGDLADRAFELAAMAKKNVVLDATMKSLGMSHPGTSGTGMLGKIQTLRDHGYRIEIRFADVLVATSSERAAKRYIGGRARTGSGRYVPGGYIRSLASREGGSSKNRDVFDKIKDTVDAYLLVDNNGHVPRTIARRGDLIERLMLMVRGLLRETNDCHDEKGQFCSGGTTTAVRLKDSLGISRKDMPQISKEQMPDFLEHLRKNGVTFKHDTVQAETLRPTQNEVDPEKVAGFVDTMQHGGGEVKRIIISSDGRVFDGHHQWAAAKELKRPLDVSRAGAPIRRLLQLAKKFAGTTHKAIGEGNDCHDDKGQFCAGGATAVRTVTGPTAKWLGRALKRAKAEGKDFYVIPSYTQVTITASKPDEPNYYRVKPSGEVAKVKRRFGPDVTDANRWEETPLKLEDYRATSLQIVRSLQEANDCHNPPGPEGGQFCPTGGAGAPARVVAPQLGKALKPVSAEQLARFKDFRDPNGEPLKLTPAAVDRLRRMVIPPAYTNVVIHPEGSSLIYTATDVKGRQQSRYSTAHTEEAAAEKFARVQEFSGAIDGIRAQVAKDLESTDPTTRDAARVIYLIDQTAIRVGSDRDTGGDKQAYGASTLLAKQVKVGGPSRDDESKVVLSFTAKKGVRYSGTFRDETLATMLRSAAEGKAPGDRLFGTSDHDVRGYFDKLTGGKFSPKDFRTYHGTRIAFEALSRHPRPRNQRYANQFAVTIKKRVAAALGNTPAVAFKSYINPLVWDRFKRWGYEVTGLDKLPGRRAA